MLDSVSVFTCWINSEPCFKNRVVTLLILLRIRLRIDTEKDLCCEEKRHIIMINTSKQPAALSGVFGVSVGGPSPVKEQERKKRIPALVNVPKGLDFIFCLFQFQSSSHPEVCLFRDPGQPKSEGGGWDEYVTNLKGAVRLCVTFSFLLPHPDSAAETSSTPPVFAHPLSSTVGCRRRRVIRRPWRARRPRRCRCSTWWGGTPRRGSTPRTSCGEL